DRAYFGNKDFQQVAVIKKMQKQLKKAVEIRTVDTKRESSGLALSSRNIRLSEAEKEKALIIYKTLNKGKEWAEQYAPFIVLQKMIDYFNESELELEYITIVHPETLQPLNQYWEPNATACVAAYCKDVRLIDNMVLVAEKS
ncbi:MAG TPA: pantoate--beta-alanine ligase, partial [Brumimicrobium sp.]|nr:pantoate--beta-alanine ligase [Brumimicrobium sp.]